MKCCACKNYKCWVKGKFVESCECNSRKFKKENCKMFDKK